MMQDRYTSNSVIERGYAIYDEWNHRKYHSRNIVHAVQTAVALTNAIRTTASYSEALSHLFALDLRIKERYDTLIKCMFRYFPWRRETAAFRRLKGMLKLPEGKDMRDVIEIELERLGRHTDEDGAEGTDRQSRGGKVHEFSGEEAAAETCEQPFETADEETLEESPDHEKGEEKEERRERVGAEKPIRDQVGTSQTGTAEVQSREPAHDREEAKAQEHREDFAFVSKEEIKEENFHEQNMANNGFESQTKPITDKTTDKVGYNSPIDVPPVFEEIHGDRASSSVSFIDEVIMDNMVKGENDVIGHNPLEKVKQEGGDRPLSPEVSGRDQPNKGEMDAHLYDKMVLNSKGEGVPNASGAPQHALHAPQNLSDAPQEQAQTVVHDQSGETRVQIKVEENLSEENLFRRSVNDQYNSKMIQLHKSLMEDALREDLLIIDLGLDEPLRLIEESSLNQDQAKIASGKKH